MACDNIIVLTLDEPATCTPTQVSTRNMNNLIIKYPSIRKLVDISIEPKNPAKGSILIPESSSRLLVDTE